MWRTFTNWVGSGRVTGSKVQTRFHFRLAHPLLAANYTVVEVCALSKLFDIMNFDGLTQLLELNRFSNPEFSNQRWWSCCGPKAESVVQWSNSSGICARASIIGTERRNIFACALFALSRPPCTGRPRRRTARDARDHTHTHGSRRPRERYIRQSLSTSNCRPAASITRTDNSTLRALFTLCCFP